MKRLVTASWLLIVSICCFPHKTYANVPRVIFDTDIGSSMCDLSVLDTAVQLDELGYMKFIGVVLDRPDKSNQDGMGRFLKFTERALLELGRSDIPIAQSMPLLDKDDKEHIAEVHTSYWSVVDSNEVALGESPMPRSNRLLEALPNAVSLYWRLLYDSYDHSISICAVGFFNNLIALLKSEANDRNDGIPMSGMELIREKVKGLWMMASCFEGDGIAQDMHGEFNVWGDIDKMDCFVELKIMFAGDGLLTSNELDVAAYALCEKELENGVAYVEIRFAPKDMVCCPRRRRLMPSLQGYDVQTLMLSSSSLELGLTATTWSVLVLLAMMMVQVKSYRSRMM